jgi:hypothetical protein
MLFRRKGKIERWIGKLQNAKPDVRRKAVETLGEIGDILAVEPLIKILEHDVLFVRWEAAEALGKIGDVRAVEPLIQALEDKDWNIRRNAVRALGQIGDRRAVEPLIQALGDRDMDVQEETITALGKISDTRTVAPLIKVLEYTNPHARWKAAEVLGEIGDTRAVEPLIKMLSDKNSYVRENAALALEKICFSINGVHFGHGELNVINYQHTWLNPDISDFTMPMPYLRKIEIYTKTYNFHQVERFITYAVNYIGQEYLKNNVEVHIYDDPNKLHPNLRNSLENLCKCVEVYEEDKGLLTE